MGSISSGYCNRSSYRSALQIMDQDAVMLLRADCMIPLSVLLALVVKTVRYYILLYCMPLPILAMSIKG